MAKIAIVTDSTTAFPVKQIGNVPLRVVPLDLHWGADTFREGIDLNADDFYAALPKRRENPTTSRPSPKAFVSVYKELLEEGYSILSIQLSARLSGTHEAAVLAQRIVGLKQPLYVHDSASLSSGAGLQILAAAQAANRGASLQECHAVLEKARDNCRIYFTVSTLKYLVRTGRMRLAQGLAAGLLGVRPILTLEAGALKVTSTALSTNAARRKLVKIVGKALQGKHLINIGASYTNDPSLAAEMRQQVANEYGILVPKDALLVPLSPVIGAYSGPGSFGIAILTD